MCVELAVLFYWVWKRFPNYFEKCVHLLGTVWESMENVTEPIETMLLKTVWKYLTQVFDTLVLCEMRKVCRKPLRRKHIHQKWHAEFMQQSKQQSKATQKTLEMQRQHHIYRKLCILHVVFNVLTCCFKLGALYIMEIYLQNARTCKLHIKGINKLRTYCLMKQRTSSANEREVSRKKQQDA